MVVGGEERGGGRGGEERMMPSIWFPSVKLMDE